MPHQFILLTKKEVPSLIRSLKSDKLHNTQFSRILIQNRVSHEFTCLSKANFLISQHVKNNIWVCFSQCPPYLIDNPS